MSPRQVKCFKQLFSMIHNRDKTRFMLSPAATNLSLPFYSFFFTICMTMQMTSVAFLKWLSQVSGVSNQGWHSHVRMLTVLFILTEQKMMQFPLLSFASNLNGQIVYQLFPKWYCSSSNMRTAACTVTNVLNNFFRNHVDKNGPQTKQFLVPGFWGNTSFI